MPKKSLAMLVILIVILVLVIPALVFLILNNSFNLNSRADSLAKNLSVGPTEEGSIVNEDLFTVQTASMDPSGTAWIGNGSNELNSYLGIRFSDIGLPIDSRIDSAKLEFKSQKDQWIDTKFTIYAENTLDPEMFSDSSQALMDRNITTTFTTVDENIPWSSNQTYTFDVTDIVKEVYNPVLELNTISFIVKGNGDSYGRKFFLANSTKLDLTYTVR